MKIWAMALPAMLLWREVKFTPVGGMAEYAYAQKEKLIQSASKTQYLTQITTKITKIIYFGTKIYSLFTKKFFGLKPPMIFEFRENRNICESMTHKKACLKIWLKSVHKHRTYSFGKIWVVKQHFFQGCVQPNSQKCLPCTKHTFSHVN